MHILLIEPDTILATSYVEALQRSSHTVRHVVSAQTAVHAADTQKPDVVVLEMQLPSHNGVEFLYEFRSYIEWSTIPVIVHTFVPLHELAHATILQRELGVARMLYKPQTSLAQLTAAIQSVVAVPA